MIELLQVTPEIESTIETYTVIALYFVVVLAIGAYFYRKSRESTGDFWIAGGEITLPIQVFAMLAVAVTAGSFFGFGGLGYELGIAAGIVFAASVGAGVLLTMMFVAAPIRRSGVYTVPDYLRVRYQSDTVRLLGALIFVIAAWGYLIPQLTAAGITMDFIFPELSYSVGVLAATVVFALYVSLGGMWAVTWTDFIQGILITVLAVLPVPYILLEFGSPSAVMSEATANSPAVAGTEAPWLLLLGLAVVWICASGALPHVGQRIMASDSDRTARRGLMWMNLIYMTIFVVNITFVVGAAMAIEPDLATGDYYYYAVLAEFTGPVVQGLGAAALLAAVMSSTDALLIALSAALSRDIPESLGMDLSEQLEMRLGALTVWLSALTAAVVAFDPPAIIGAMITFIAGGVASGLFPAMFLGTWWKRANRQGALASMIIGFGAYGVLLVAGVMPYDFTEALITVPLGIAVLVGVSLATDRPTVEELTGFEAFHEREVRPDAAPDDD